MRPRRTVTNWAVILLALALGIIAQGYFAQKALLDGLIVYAVAVVLFLLSTRRLRMTPRPPSPARPEEVEGNGYARQLIASALFVLAAVATLLALRLFGDGASPSRAWTLHLGSIVLFLLSVYIAQPGRASSGRRRLSFRRYEIVLLLVILAVAAFMRLYRIDSWPYGTWYDEADNGLHVLRMMEDPTYRPVFVPSTNLPAHFLYLIMFSFKIFGPSTLSIRLVTVAMGIATAVAGYFFGREFFGRRLGFVLGFLLAVSRWDVNFSRIGLHGVSTPLFELLVLYFLLKGLRTQSRVDFAWAGVWTGLGLSFYAPFRLFPFVIVVFLLHAALKERAFLRRHAANLVLMFLAALIIVAPVAQYALDHSEEFWSRTRKVSIFKTQPRDRVVPAILDNAGKHLLMFNYKGDPNGRHNLPGAPMLDRLTSTLFVFGAAFSLARLGSPCFSLLIVWLLVMLGGGIFSLTFEAPQSLRAIGSLPAAYTLAVVPLALFRRLTRHTFPRSGRTIFAVCALVILGWIGWDNYNVYFNVQARNPSSWNAYSTVETIMAREINKLGAGYHPYFAEVLTNHLTTRFLAPGLGPETPFAPVKHLPLRESGERGAVVFLDADSFNLIEMIRHYYPELDVETFGPPFGGRDVLARVTISREQIESIQGLPVRYFHEGADPQLSVYDRVGPLHLDWRVDAPLEFPFDAEWRGVLVAPDYGSYEIRFEGLPREAVTVRLDGAVLLGGEEELTRSIRLAQGNHALHIRAHVETPSVLDLQWRRPGGEWETIPRTALYGPPVTADGLVGSYYANADWSPPARFVRVDPEIAYYFHLVPLQRPYTVEWLGRLVIPEAGRYSLGVEMRDEAWLYIDGELVLHNDAPDQYRSVALTLTAEAHDIRLRFLDKTDHSHVYLYWTPPAGGRQIIPHRYLLPHPGGGWQAEE